MSSTRHGRLEIRLDSELKYRVAFGELVVYENGVRTIGGRAQPYRFRSVEQLRYDFEQDVKAAGGALG